MLIVNEETYALANSGKLEDIKAALQKAIELEHSTMPPYLYAFYSLHTTKQSDNDHGQIATLLLDVVEEEMLHMLLACNLLISIGGRPEIDLPSFVPNYPTPLPGCVASGLIIPLRKLSLNTIESVFMRIEEPEFPIDIQTRALEFAAFSAIEPVRTIGEFYRLIRAAFEKYGDEWIDASSADQQPTAEPLGGTNAKTQIIDSKDKALEAIDLIVEQGEGTSDNPFAMEEFPDDPRNMDLAHYYRFKSIIEGKIARNPDATEETPPSDRVVFDSNDRFRFDEARVLPFPDNPKAADFAVGTEEREAVDAFNRIYTRVLRLLHASFNGDPDRIDAAIGEMGAMRSAAQYLAETFQLGPTFEYLPDATDDSPTDDDTMEHEDINMPNAINQEFIELIRRLRDDSNAARRHRRIRFEGESTTLADLFDESLDGNENLTLLLRTLKEKKSVRTATMGRPLVVAGKPDESVLMSIITPGSDDEIRSMSRNFEASDRDIVRRWIESLPPTEASPVAMPPMHVK